MVSSKKKINYGEPPEFNIGDYLKYESYCAGYCTKRERRRCNRCNEILCSHHFDTITHATGCICKICGRKNWDGCEHGIIYWYKSEILS